MDKDSLKHEIIQWITNLDDPETLEFLKIIKDTNNPYRNWWGSTGKDSRKNILSIEKMPVDTNRNSNQKK